MFYKKNKYLEQHIQYNVHYSILQDLEQNILLYMSKSFVHLNSKMLDELNYQITQINYDNALSLTTTLKHYVTYHLECFLKKTGMIHYDH